LSLQGYEADIACDGPAGLRKWKQLQPDLIVLDIMLPGIDGLSVLRAIRLEDERLPILVLSAKAASDDKIKGLSLGVDDYLAKPFNLEEFLLRVERLIKRSEWGVTPGQEDANGDTLYQFGHNTIDFASGTATCRQGRVNLTEQEIKVLKLFIANQGKPLSRKVLLEIGWGYPRTVSSRTIDNFMVRFRKYFEDDPKKPQHFISVRAVGYIFTTTPSHHPPKH
jgi:DNA-binding response OmpR family regulator